jgi:peptidoglycan/xylan/chitin deacetylase (PgdA/CDA1 family)
MDILKQLLLTLYYHGSRPVRWLNDTRAAADELTPISVLYYHRIADDNANDWTMSNSMFARQIEWLQKHFELISLKTAQERIRGGVNHRPCVSITFDDGYADNCQQAIPLLIREKIPCTYFVTLGNVLDGEPFAHDLANGDTFLPNTVEELRAMSAAGIEIGAHTYSHADIARIRNPEKLRYEVVSAGKDLEEALGRPVRFFAFPYGLHANLSSEGFLLAQQSGYEAACSAYGGYNFPGDDAFHIQRIPASNDMIHLKNWTTIDPRKVRTPRFNYRPELLDRPANQKTGV